MSVSPRYEVALSASYSLQRVAGDALGLDRTSMGNNATIKKLEIPL